MLDKYITRYKLTDTDIRVARKIRERRIELRIKQSEIAAKIGVTTGNMTQIEMGRNRVNPTKLRQIADILQKPVSYFIGDEEKYFEDITLKENKPALDELMKKWKIKKFLANKNLPQNFIDDVELQLQYLCELHRVNIDDIW